MRKKTVSPLSLSLLIAISVGYSLPLKAVKFYSYTNENGETVYSNVPQSCITNSVMTCMDHHPAIHTAEPALDSVSRPDTANRRASSPVNSANLSSRSTARQNQAVEDGLFDVLENIGEMNAIVNEYFPGNSDPVEAAKVRERQEKILEVLEVIKRGAGEDERTSINRAIGILRDNLVD